MQRRRDKLRAAGLRPVQIWIPDARANGFAAECARQAHVIQAADGQDDAEQGAWIDMADTSGWTA